MTDSIKAPEGTYLRAYLVDFNPFCNGVVRHALIDEHGMVFVRGYGWSSLQDSYKMFVLPAPVERGNSPEGWNWDEYWESNWKCSSWGWIYMQRPLSQFQACYTITEPNGDTMVFAH